MKKRLRTLAYLFFAVIAAFYLGLIWSFTPRNLAWQQAADSPLPRFEGPGVEIDGRLYLFFGYREYIETGHILVATDDVSSYDPATDTWRQHRPSPFTGTHLNAVYDGRFVWFAGGFAGNHPGEPLRSVWKYDPGQDTWSRGPELPATVGGGALVLAGKELHYISGYFEPMQEPATEYHWVLDLDAPGAVWRDEPSLPVARGHAAGVAVGDYIYLIGGSLTHHPTWIDSALVHRYDTRRNVWERMADLPYPASHFEPGAYALGDDIVIAGGRNGESAQLSDLEMQDIFIYRTGNDRWELAGSLPLPLRAPVVRKIGDRVIVTTGSTYWAQAPQRSTYVLSCDGESTPLCAEGAGAGTIEGLRLRLKSFYKSLAAKMPWKAQTLMGLKHAARIE